PSSLSSLHSLFFLITSLPPPISTLFPYTTLFRSPGRARRRNRAVPPRRGRPCRQRLCPPRPPAGPRPGRAPRRSSGAARARRRRSEEHTSELQSRGHLVCRLLLEKKKK